MFQYRTQDLIVVAQSSMVIERETVMIMRPMDSNSMNLLNLMLVYRHPVFWPYIFVVVGGGGVRFFFFLGERQVGCIHNNSIER